VWHMEIYILRQKDSGKIALINLRPPTMYFLDNGDKETFKDLCGLKLRILKLEKEGYKYDRN